MAHWVEKSPAFVRVRYDRLAPIYGAFEWLYALPLLGIRRRSIDALELRPGDSLLEVGCGSGCNFDLAGPIDERRISFGYVSQFVICGATKPGEPVAA